MVSKATSESRSTRSNQTTVYGHLDCEVIAEIDRVADQMLMPRSWVVTQILQEWYEQRTMEITQQEQSWNDSYREVLGTLEPDELERRRALSA